MLHKIEFENFANVLLKRCQVVLFDANMEIGTYNDLNTTELVDSVFDINESEMRVSTPSLNIGTFHLTVHDRDKEDAAYVTAKYYGESGQMEALMMLLTSHSKQLTEDQPDPLSENFKEQNLKSSDFSNRNLDGVDFSSLNLTGSNFSGASLMGANFKNAVIDSCNFMEADLREANLKNASVWDSDFTKTDMREAIIDDVVLSVSDGFAGANFSGMNLEYIELQGIDLQGCDFTNCNLSHADLSLSNLEKTNMHGANLEGANVTGTCLEK